MSNDVFEQVKEIVSPYCKNKAALENATAETSFLEDLQINSARLVDIVIDFEDEFDIEVSDEEADKIRTMGDAVTVIKAKT
ncbi:acyl carrier protein [Marinicella pacifica]|jgi:acyl carrier protein|uniref:Acyl carrier protein n=1 Tax=Marinicella pacifica TaxID=1171543 RepID=A0A917CZA5_9GAMM|nr:acyl carrier protein [Marinicella pacifica]GGG03037.1 acyl carrier protein [Marinicella pacifica]